MATHFSYNNMAEIRLCGTILEQEYFLQPKMVASIIAVSKIRNLQTWNKYISRLGTLADVPEPDREYFGSLPDRENTTSILLGMSVIGKITWLALADELRDLDDPVFEEILDQVGQQKEKKLSLVSDHLRNRIEGMTDDERRQIQSDARHYRGQARETLLYHHTLLRDVGKDSQQIADHAEDEITAFYSDIGINL